MHMALPRNFMTIIGRWWNDWRNVLQIVQHSKQNDQKKSTVNNRSNFITRVPGKRIFCMSNWHSVLLRIMVHTFLFSFCGRIYTTFGIWLEETRLNKVAQIRIESFPPSYDLYHLSMIFSNNTVSMVPLIMAWNLIICILKMWCFWCG